MTEFCRGPPPHLLCGLLLHTSHADAWHKLFLVVFQVSGFGREEEFRLSGVGDRLVLQRSPAASTSFRLEGLGTTHASETSSLGEGC